MLADAQHVHERPARIANRLEDPPEASLAVVLDDEAGAWRDAGLEVTIDAAGVTDRGVRASLVKATSQGPVLDQKLHVQAGQQDLVQGPDDQLILADGETPHDGLSVPPTGRAGSTGGSFVELYDNTTYDAAARRVDRVDPPSTANPPVQGIGGA